MMLEESNRTPIGELILVFVSVFLFVFQTTTIFATYYHFYVTILCAVCIFTIRLTRERQNFKIPKYTVTLVCYIIFVSILEHVVKNGKGMGFLSVNVTIPLWMCIYDFCKISFTQKKSKNFRMIIIIAFLLNLILTFRGLMTNHNASRLLAGAATQSEFSDFYLMGIGGYGFIFGAIFFMYGVFNFYLNSNFKSVKKLILLYLLAAFSYVVVLYASYTIAIIMYSIILLIALYEKNNNKLYRVLIVILFIVVVLFKDDIMNSFIRFSDENDLYYVSNRFGQLVNVSNGSSDVEDLKRYKLYSDSFEQFLENPMFGGVSGGGHSFFLDYIGRYGIFGLGYVYIFIKCVNEFAKNVGKKYQIICSMFYILLFVNTMDPIVMVPYVLFALPSFMIPVKKRET